MISRDIDKAMSKSNSVTSELSHRAALFDSLHDNKMQHGKIILGTEDTKEPIATPPHYTKPSTASSGSSSKKQSSGKEVKTSSLAGGEKSTATRYNDEMPSMKSQLQPLGSDSMFPEANRFHILGYEARKKGEFKTAVMYYTKALEIHDRFFKAYFNRGFAYDKLEEYDKAIEDYTKALEIEPNNAFGYYNRGISLDKMKEYDAAIDNFSKAISLDSKRADFYHNRGFAYRKKKEIDKAIKDYSKAVELDPSHFKVRKHVH